MIKAVIGQGMQLASKPWGNQDDPTMQLATEKMENVSLKRMT
jgi:hypothetical protein